MARLRCDKCGGPTNTFGSWDCPMTIICGKCQDKMETEKKRKEKMLEISRYRESVRNNISKL